MIGQRRQSEGPRGRWPADRQMRLRKCSGQVLESARLRGECAIGYRVGNEAYDPAKATGVRLNPDKSEPVAFSAGDRIAVLAEQ